PGDERLLLCRVPHLFQGGEAGLSLDIRLKSLRHLNFCPMIDCPGDFMGHGFEQPSGGWVAVAAFLDSAEGEVDLGADAGEVDVAHAELTLLAEEAHRAVILGYDGERKAVLGVVVDAGRVFVRLEGDEGDMGTEDLLADGTDAGTVVHAVDKRREI